MDRVLQVRRLTAQESQNEWFKHDGDEIPPKARIVWVCKFLCRTDKTIAKYRETLFAGCWEYQTITCMNGIDNPILVKRQIELLKEFRDLMDTHKNIEIAIAMYNLRHPSPTDDLSKWGLEYEAC